MKLCDYGLSTFFRDEPAYSVQWLEGAGNEMQCQGEADTGGAALRRFQSPWGLFHMDGTRLNEKLKLAPPVWPALPREQAVARDNVDLAAATSNRRRTKPALERVSDLIDVTAAFSFDKQSPRDAFAQFARLPPEQAPLLVDALEPAAIDQLIQLSIIIPAHGDAITRDILKRLDGFPLQKKSVLINFLRMGRPSTVMDDMLRRLGNPKTRTDQTGDGPHAGHAARQQRGRGTWARALLMRAGKTLKRARRRRRKKRNR